MEKDFTDYTDGAFGLYRVEKNKVKRKKRNPGQKMKKILLFNHHFASVPYQLYEDFKESVILRSTFSEWIKKELEKEFDYPVFDETDFGYLELKMHDLYYTDKSDWLRSHMRQELQKYQDVKNIMRYFYISRKTETGHEVYLCEDEKLMNRYHERFVYWSESKEHVIMFSTPAAARIYAQKECSASCPIAINSEYY